jgi:two-component system LytT family sensor kinase
MTHADTAALLHAVGFVTGIALYAMLGAMVLRSELGRGTMPAASRGRDRIALATAGLGLLWNGGALVAYGAPVLLGAGAGGARLEWVAAVAFAALGVLPAVVVHAALQGDRGRGRTALIAAAYALSATGAALQLSAAATGGAVPARAALQLLSVGFAVVLALLGVRLRRHAGGRGPLAAAALAAFAVMALHLGHHGEPGESLLAEVLGDHASIALALVILYQDFRFALADLFLKRVLAVVLLVSVALAGYLVAAPLVGPLLARDASDPRAVAVLLALWIATALAYPTVRRGVHAFVDRVVLRRADYGALRRALPARLAAHESPEAVLDATCAELAPALAAEVTWRGDDGATSGAAPVWTDARHQAVAVPVPTGEAPTYVLAVAALRGGRRLLSDDLALLESAAVAAARRIDALRVLRERWDREAREREIRQLATEAELRALRAQLNPHFLFNALTTVGHLLQEAPDRALATLLRLTGLLRAVLRPTAGELVTLGEEMEIVEAYLAIEQARFEERLRGHVDVPAALHGLRLPALLLQPLVENAVKHGITPLRAGGEVRVVARLEPATADASTDRLHLTVSDTGAGVAPSEAAARRARGLGLASVEQRLERRFGAAASFRFESAPGQGTTVELRLPLLDATSDRGVPPAASGRMRALVLA